MFFCFPRISPREITREEKAHCQVSSLFLTSCSTTGSLSTWWWRQYKRHQTKGLRSKTNAVHEHCKSLYNSSPSSAKQELEMTKFCIVWGNCELWQLIFHLFMWNWIFLLHNNFSLSMFYSHWCTERIWKIANSAGKISVLFWLHIVLSIAVIIA